MPTPAVSIIVPVYNASGYLKKCYESLATQSLTDIEIVLVDDGSTDASLSLCQSFAKVDPRVKVFAKENEGQGVARNLGIEVAKSPYVCYVDSDDWVDPSMCARAVEAIESEEADFVSFSLDFVRPSGRMMKSVRLDRYARLTQPQLFYSALIDDQVLTTPCNKLYRRSFLVGNNIKFPSTRFNEDIFYSRAVAYTACKTAFLPEVLYHALVRPESTSRRMSTAHFDSTREVLAREREFFAQHSGPSFDESLFAAHVVKVFSYLLAQAAFRVSSPCEYRKCFEIANACKFSELARSSMVLAKLPKKNQLLASLCRHRSLLRGVAHVSRLVGVLPY